MKKTIILLSIAFSVLSVSAHAANASDTTAPAKNQVSIKAEGGVARPADLATQDVFVLNAQDLQYLESILSESNLIVNGKALSIKEGVSLLQWLESKKLQVPVAEKEKKK